MIFDIINEDPGFMTSSSLDDVTKAGKYGFVAGDSKKDFVRRLETKPKDWYYRHNTVEYTLNSHKFRTKEFKDIDWKNSIVLIGCSCTFGTGVTDDHTIAAHLERITGKYVVNLGQIAAGNSVIAYNSHYLKENYPTPLAVVHIWSTMARWLWVHYDDKSKLKHLMFELLNYKPLASSAEIEGTDLSHPNSRVVTESKVITEITHNVINMKMINSLWKDHPNYLQLTMYDYLRGEQAISMAAKIFPEIIQLKRSWVDDTGSRDGLHWTNETNQKVAKLISRNLKL